MTELDIRKFLLTYAGRYNGELRQDTFVQAITASKQQGYFVEFGAMDGRCASNTLVLEQDLDWTGILAEPGRRFHSLIAAERQCRIDHRAVTGRTGDRQEFKEVDRQPGLSTLTTHLLSDDHGSNRQSSTGHIYMVETVSLSDLLDQHSAPYHIDYVSMDTEGSELDILTGFDFDRRRIDIWTIEHNFQAMARQKIFEIMAHNGYRRVLTDMSGYDDWYIRTDMIT